LGVQKIYRVTVGLASDLANLWLQQPPAGCGMNIEADGLAATQECATKRILLGLTVGGTEVHRLNAHRSQAS
jgi:hypothetical protein